LEAAHAVILSWNELMGRIGRWVGRFWIFPEVSAEFLNTFSIGLLVFPKILKTNFSDGIIFGYFIIIFSVFPIILIANILFSNLLYFTFETASDIVYSDFNFAFYFITIYSISRLYGYDIIGNISYMVCFFIITIKLLYVFNQPHIKTTIDSFTCARIDPPPARCAALLEDG